MTWDFLPHGICWNWDPLLVSLETGFNLVIAAAYTAIPVLLLRARRGAQVPLSPVLAIFAAFIWLCGLTHVADVLLIWRSAYLLDVIVRALTAAVSVVAVMVTIRYGFEIGRGLRAAHGEQLEE